VSAALAASTTTTSARDKRPRTSETVSQNIQQKFIQNIQIHPTHVAVLGQLLQDSLPTKLLDGAAVRKAP